jgi:hypothetical protein
MRIAVLLGKGTKRGEVELAGSIWGRIVEDKVSLLKKRF